MTFVSKPEGSGDKADKWLKAVELNKKIIGHQKRALELHEQMTLALYQECLKQYKWEGPAMYNSPASRLCIYKAENLKVLEGTKCSESPVGSHVIPRHMEHPDYASVAKAVCLCCDQKLIKTSISLGWMTGKDRLEHEKKKKAAQKEGFRSVSEYEAWVGQEFKRRQLEEARQIASDLIS